MSETYDPNEPQTPNSGNETETESTPPIEQPVPASGGAVPTGAEPAEGGEAEPMPTEGQPQPESDSESRGHDE